MNGEKNIIRSRSPLRIGLAGGGTDVSPYSEIYGGAILNATINAYAYAILKPGKRNGIVINCADMDKKIELNSSTELEINGEFDLIKGIYNRIVKDYTHKELSFELTTYVDAPAGSGLGSSSTLVTAVLGAFVEWLKLPLGEYDIAHLAYEIERIDLNMSGGKQDQYAATFGGFNFIEFYSDDKVIVNPLRIKQEYINELEFNIVLFYTGISRYSSAIIEQQSRNVIDNRKNSIDAMHRVKEQSILMKEALLKGNLDLMGDLLDHGWKFKKQTADQVSNDFIDEIYEEAIKAGATGGKLSGAGGGGFFFFYCPDNTRYKVMEALTKFNGEFRRYQFTDHGLTSWTI